MDSDASPDRTRGYRSVVLVALVTALAAGAGGYVVGTRAATALPSTTSPEAGFARDMQTHHLQGVEMSMIVRDRTGDEDVRRMAYDMATTQGHQAGQLYGWLAAWGLGQMGSDPPMTWMGHTGHGMGALMPGMATAAQVAELSAASGIDAERLFLRLMIEHHRGAVQMAAAALERSDHPVVLAFARAVMASQQSEIDLMTKMLTDREGK